MTSRRAATALAAVVTAAVAAVAPAAPSAAAEPLAPARDAAGAATGVIVRWAADADNRERTAAVRAAGVGRGQALPLARAEAIAVRPGTADEVVAELADDPAVAYVEPDLPLAASSGDPLFPMLWGLHNTGQRGSLDGQVDVYGVPDVDVDAPEAWATTGVAAAAPVVVAVIDEGVDLTHPDLAGAAWVNADEVPGNGLDDDRNGFVDDVHGWDFVHGDASVFDAADGDAHGTHVAGTIAARAGNGTGIAGVAPNAKVMALKHLGPDGGVVSTAIAAIDYAKANGARLVNASWGGEVPSRMLRDKIAESGLLFVAAAGNGGDDGRGDDAATSPHYPAAFRLPNLVSVAAVDRTGALAPYSNYGATAIDLGAPGSAVVSTYPGGRYALSNGTSMATPHVAGVAALLAGLDPDAPAAELADLLTSSTAALPALAGRTVTGGMVNAAAAIATLRGTPASGSRLATQPAPTTAEPAPVAPAPTEAVPTEPVPGEVCPASLASAGFTDVPRGTTHAANIDCVVGWGLASGVGDGRYGPERQVTRAQMASFLAGVVRVAGLLPEGAPDRFADDDGSVHEGSINAMAQLGILNGSSDGTYRPGAVVTRAQMATFLVNLQEFVTGTAMPDGDTPFVDAVGVHATSIRKAFTAGLSSGVTPTTFGATAPVRRDQMASFLRNELAVLVTEGLLTPPA